MIRHLRLPLGLRLGADVQHIHEQRIDVDGLGRQRVDRVTVARRQVVGELRPELADSHRTRRTRRDDVVEILILQDIHIVHDHFFKSLPIAGSQSGHAAAGIVVGQENADLMVVKHLKAGFGDVDVNLVPKAAGEESCFDAAFAHGRIHVADRTVQGLCRQLGHMAIAEHGLQQGRTYRILRLGLILEDEVLERRAQTQQRTEQARIGEQHPKRGLLDGRKPQICRHNSPRLKENVGRLHT